MNIWLFQTGEPLPFHNSLRKMRTALLADKFVERGHSLLWWASAYEHQRKIWLSDKDRNYQLNANYTIRVLHGTGYKKNISFARYIDHLVVARRFRLQSGNYEKPDVIVASMPCYHLAYEAMRYARRKNIPFIVDIRDLWPDIFINSLRNYGLHSIGRFVLSRDFNKLSSLLGHADGIGAISQGCLDWGLNKINRSQNKWDQVFYHGYLPSGASSAIRNPNASPEFKDKKIFLFVGTFGESYELDLVAEVAKRFNEAGNNELAFYLVGTGEQYNDLKKKSVHLTNLRLPGWLGADQIRRFLNAAWAGIIPCKSVKNAAPNKVFEYLSAGLPLISSLEGEIADLIEQYEIGLNYRAGDAGALYQCICRLATNDQLRQRMSKNAHIVFEKYGDADRIYKVYADYVEKLVENFNKID